MKHLPLTLLALLLSSSAVAQNFLGYSSDNFSGIHQVMVNPALLADSPVKVDINLVSAAGTLTTDYTDLSISSITDLLNGENLTENSNPQDDNRAFVYADVFGPSFFFKLNDKSALAFTSRVRTLSNFENINGELLEAAINGFPGVSFSFNQENLNFQTHPFAELGVSYSRVLYDQDRLKLKGGATLKYLMGGGIAQGFSNNLNGRYSLFTLNVSLEGDFAYQTSFADDQEVFDPGDILSNAETGLGFDFGFVLDIKPVEWENSGFTNAPYKWRIGVALNDLGNVTYAGAEDNRYSFDSDEINGDEFEEDFEASIELFQDESSIRDIKVSLPSTLRLTVDYHILDNFFANLDIQQNMVSEDGPSARSLNRLTVTPRWQTRGIGVFVPISTSEFAEGSMGLGFRLGPLFLGSHTLFSQLFSDNARIANAYVGLKIPINHKKAVAGDN